MSNKIISQLKDSKEKNLSHESSKRPSKYLNQENINSPKEKPSEIILTVPIIRISTKTASQRHQRSQTAVFKTETSKYPTNVLTNTQEVKSCSSRATKRSVRISNFPNNLLIDPSLLHAKYVTEHPQSPFYRRILAIPSVLKDKNSCPPRLSAKFLKKVK